MYKSWECKQSKDGGPEGPCATCKAKHTTCWTDGISLSAKAQIQYNKELGRSRRGQNRGVRKVREVTPEVVKEVVREELRDEVRDGSESEDEDDGIRMVHLIDDKLEEVRKKVDRTDVMVRALVRKGIGKGSQEVLERFVEGLGDEEPEDLNSLEGIDNRYVVKMRRLEKLADEVRREWYEAAKALDGREEVEAEETGEEEEEEVRSEGVGRKVNTVRRLITRS